MTTFYSTNDKTVSASLKEAVLNGLAPDGGLYMPHELTRMPSFFLDQIHTYTIREIAFEISKHILGEAIPDDVLKRIVRSAINFEAPLVKLADGRYVLELFHGPTLAFKDFGARFMAQVMGYLAKDIHHDINILVATSGDTGGAVADGFHNVPGINVWILYPQGKVSEIQEHQLTTVGHNVKAIEVKGTFDDCQALVKEAFNDKELKKKTFLSSANSINIARLIPQSFYYFSAYAQLQPPFDPVVFSVPSGNYGNLTAGLFASALGLPVKQFIASSNANDSVPKYLTSGVFATHASYHTISNAMDVGNPSNFARMLDLYQNDLSLMQKHIVGFAFDDEQTRKAIRYVYDEYDYTLDPHTAVGYLGLQKYLQAHPNTTGIILATAHPAKFLDVVEPIIEKKIALPPLLEHALKKQKDSILMNNNYNELKKLLENL